VAEAFESDESFLGYVEIHSQTERALFHRDHVVRFLKLAGIWGEGNAAKYYLPDFSSMHWSDIEPTMKLARRRLTEPRPTAKIIPFPVRKS
jgi:hypothetical protein